MKTKWHIGAFIVALLVAITVTGAAGAQDQSQREPGRAVRAIMEAVVEQTGLSAREVLERVRDGQALAEIITAQGGDVEVVAEAAEAALTERIHTAVAEGLITQQQADEALENLPATVRRVLSGEIPQQLVGRGDAAPCRSAQRAEGGSR